MVVDGRFQAPVMRGAHVVKDGVFAAPDGLDLVVELDVEQGCLGRQLAALPARAQFGRFRQFRLQRILA
ncbi:hypothetical protein D3C87_1922280 [compost metagenome]